ncbi:MAG: hypothetical protein IJL20_03020 [Lachnospiraceae bacterium]|nr:hypothetical protein [Lachnospiraceae bacterium]
MKISKIAKLVKDAGCVQLIQVDVYTMYIGVGGAIYATEDLPLISGAEQARAVLDFTKKQMESIEVTEYSGTLSYIDIGLNMKSDDKEAIEWEVKRIPAAAVVDNEIVDILELEDGEILLFDSTYLSPLKEEQKSPYFKFKVRETPTKQKYIVVYDGLFIKAVIMPMKVDVKYFEQLDNFVNAMNKVRPVDVMNKIRPVGAEESGT